MPGVRVTDVVRAYWALANDPRMPASTRLLLSALLLRQVHVVPSRRNAEALIEQARREVGGMSLELVREHVRRGEF